MAKAKQQWTADDINDMQGKVVIVTGANSGLGFETAKLLAGKRAEVVLACRASEKAEQACSEIKAEYPQAKLRVIKLDLQDLASIKEFVDDFRQNFNRLDVLMNNAGIMNAPYSLTVDGFESQTGTNHLGHFALTGLLLPILKATPSSRVVNVSSLAHKTGKMDFNNLLFKDGKGYTPIKAYSRSKLANLLFTFELQKQFELHHLDCMAIAAHPGAAQTQLGKYMEDAMVLKLFGPLLSRVVQNAFMGALPQIRAAVDQAVQGGDYYGPEGLFEFSGYPVKVSCTASARNSADAKRLWLLSEKLTGVHYEF